MSITQNYTTTALKDGSKQYKGMSVFLSKRVYFAPPLGKHTFPHFVHTTENSLSQSLSIMLDYYLKSVFSHHFNNVMFS